MSVLYEFLSELTYAPNVVYVVNGCIDTDYLNVVNSERDLFNKEDIKIY